MPVTEVIDACYQLLLNERVERRDDPSGLDQWRHPYRHPEGVQE
jgi:hypothetical protein